MSLGQYFLHFLFLKLHSENSWAQLFPINFELMPTETMLMLFNDIYGLNFGKIHLIILNAV